jgi:signal peptidase I
MKNALRSIALLAVILSSLTLVANASVRMVAPVIPVSMDEALADAKVLTSIHTDATVLQVSGSSMHPFFGNGSLLVIKPIDISKLRAGMVVVYTNRLGETVAHRLVSQQINGWVVQGYNNSQPDSTLVDASNLRGVVYATIHTSGETQGLASLASSLPVALAAPAK